MFNELLPSLTDDDLRVLIMAIKLELTNRKERQDYETIRKNVLTKGYAWGKTEEPYEYPDIISTYFPFKLEMHAYEKRSKSDAKIVGVSEDNSHWTEDFEGVEEFYKNNERDYTIDGEWDPGDWDDPATCTITYDVPVYFLDHELPEIGEQFSAYNKYGYYYTYIRYEDYILCEETEEEIDINDCTSLSELELYMID